MLKNKLWIYNEIPDNEAEIIAKRAGISALMAKIFISRGISDIEYIRNFLSPDLDKLYDPFLMKDMDKAVKRIEEALQKKEKILIYGDYDVDGITSTSILYDFLKRLNAEVEYYIPDRQVEGYGLSIGAIDKISEMEISLIITVDCGITACDEVRYVIDQGIDIIITDHHQCKEKLPDASAIINPCRPDCDYPFKYLAGVGVTFKLITALCKYFKLGNIHYEYLDIVALGTVADVVPIVDENRIIVKYGIEKMESTSNLGLKALIDCAGFKDKPITSFVIGFGLAPRINAAGRVGDASRAVRLFIATDKKNAAEIAEELNSENKFRQETEMLIMQQVTEMIESQLDLEKEKVIVVAGEGWHHGVIGIVASKITERYYKPCILLACEQGACKGSGRSIEGFNLFNALNYCSDLLVKFGGHELAAGLSILEENLLEFKNKINSYADQILTEEDLKPKIKIDITLDKKDITMDNIRELNMMSPFGAGNPGPLFVYNGIKISDIRTVGENKHLKLKLVDGSFYTDAIGFNMGGAAEDINCSDLMDIACSMEINTWNSVDRIQFNLKDIRYNSKKHEMNIFYETLDNCISWRSDSLVLHNIHEIAAENKLARVMTNKDEFINVVNESIKAGKNLAILVNDIKSVEPLEKILKSLDTSIKNTYKVCYTYNNSNIVDKIQIIVNPALEKINCSFYGTVIAYGRWIDLHYLLDIANYIDKLGLFLYNIELYNIVACNIVPERNDLVAVYQYVKSKGKKVLQVDNIHVASDKIKEIYKVNMNFFKFKQSLEIFEELELLKKEYNGINSVTIVMDVNKKLKTNLERSAKYMRLKALKG